MTRRLMVCALPLSLMLAVALTAEGQVGLWVSTPTGVTTSGTMNVDGNASFGGNVGLLAGASAPFFASNTVVPIFSFGETDAATDWKVWRWQVNNGALDLWILNDVLSVATSLLTVNRSAATGGQFTFNARVNSGAAQPGFLAYTSTATAFGAGAAVLTFDAESYDTTSSFAGSVFTAPVTGVYEFHASVFCSAAGAGGAVLTLVSGAGNFQLLDTTGTNVEMSGSSIVVRLTAGQTARVDISTPSGGTLRGFAPPATYRSRFSGRLML